jgi:hypothetical protein
MVRATTNPYGAGHNWVKQRFKPNTMSMVVRRDILDQDGNFEPPRLSIHSHIDENIALLEADPDYKQKISASARNEAERKAWLEGSWDIVAGGMFDDVWNPKWNRIKAFPIPESWRITRSFDWGDSKPFSVGWWAVSDGSDVQDADGIWRSTIRGDIFRIREWYGWTGKPNEGLQMLATDIAEGMVERELHWGYRRRGENWCRVRGGVADSQIFVAENGNCIATDMKVRVRLDDGFKYPGIQWQPADKRPGSRKTGWVQMRQMMKQAHPNVKKHPKDENKILVYPRERPGLFIFDTCPLFCEMIPVLPRDEKDMDDVDTDAEDHIADESRYLVRYVSTLSSSGKTSGNY